MLISGKEINIDKELKALPIIKIHILLNFNAIFFTPLSSPYKNFISTSILYKIIFINVCNVFLKKSF